MQRWDRRQLARCSYSIFGYVGLPYVFLTRAARRESDWQAKQGGNSLILERIGWRGLCPSFFALGLALFGQSPGELGRQYPRQLSSP